jgi:DNA helicase IV
MLPGKKEEIVASYHSRKNALKEEKSFRDTNVHGDCIGRIDLDTFFHDYDNLFKNHYYTKLYISEKPIGEPIPLDIETVVWQIEAGLYKEQSGGLYHGGGVFSAQYSRNFYYDTGIVVDWRSPIAELYYSLEKTDLTIGSAYRYDHSLMLKRRFRDGDIDDLYTFGGALHEHEILDPFLKEIMKDERNKHKLSHIIKTIVPNQNAIIRYPLDKMIVQGCAGSGKTVILLHRLSYLKFNNLNLDFDTVKIITPNELLNLHVDDLSTVLEVDKVKRCTMEQYYARILSTYDNCWNTKVIMSESDADQVFVNFIYSDDFISIFGDNYKTWADNLNTKMGAVGAISEKYKLQQTVDSQGSDNLSVKTMQRYLPLIEKNLADIISLVQDNKKRESEYERDYAYVQGRLNDLADELTQRYDFKERSIRKMLDNAMAQLSAAEEACVTSDDAAKSIAEEEIRLLNASISSFDAQLTKNRKKNADVVALKRCANNITNTARNDIHKVLEMFQINDEELNIAISNVKDLQGIVPKTKREIRRNQRGYYKDIDAALTNEDEEILQALNNDIERDGESDLETIRKTYDEIRSASAPEVFSDIFNKAIAHQKYKLSPVTSYRFVLYAQLVFGLKFYGKSKVKDKYLFIDEGQDIAVNEYRLLKDINSNNPILNIFGDTNQLIKTAGRGISDWGAITDSNMRLFAMNEDYRNAIQITEYCNKCLDTNLVSMGFTGEEVRIMTKAEMVAEINARNYCDQRIAIIAKKATHDFIEELKAVIHEKQLALKSLKENAISVLDVETCKGLEYDVAYVFQEGMSRNEKYISFTRALNELNIIG